MTILASTRKLAPGEEGYGFRPVNDDAEPYLYSDGSRREFGGSYSGMWPKLCPRREFDRPRAHEGNPILYTLRDEMLAIHNRNRRIEYAHDRLLLIYRYMAFGGYQSDDQARLAVIQRAGKQARMQAVDILDRYLAIWG